MLPFVLPEGLKIDDLNSRQRTAVVAAATLVHQAQPSTIVQIVEEGERSFFRMASSDEGYGSQDLGREDYRLIYLLLVSHVQQHLTTVDNMGRADG